MAYLVEFYLLISLTSSALSNTPETNENPPEVVSETELNDPILEIEHKESPHFGQLHSLENLTMWAIYEELIVALLEKRLNLIEEEASLIKSFLSDYEESSGKAIENAHGSNLTLEEQGRIVGSSFVLGHRMTSRFCGVTKKLREFLKSSEYMGVEESMKKVLSLSSTSEVDQNETEDLSGKFYFVVALPIVLEFGPTDSKTKTNMIAIPRDWPDWPDMYMSMTSILALQETNGIPPAKLINGLTINTAAGGHLNAMHCAEIGMFALRRKRYYMAVDWLEMALELARAENVVGNGTIALELVQSLLLLAIQEHNKVGNELNAPWNMDRSTYLDLFEEPLTEIVFIEKINVPNFRQTTYLEHRGLEAPHRWLQAQHIDACIGITRQTPKMQINLKCYYEKTRHPYLYINPVKVEKLAENPPIFQFYEMLSNETIEHIKYLSSPRLRLTALGGIEVDDWDKITDLRSSVDAGMDHTEIPKAYKLAEMVSGLKVIDASDPTYVAEYTYGRQRQWHTDAHDDSSNEVVMHGNRLATMLYYIEIPELGGLTSFCQAGIAGHYVRGSAVLWYNLHRNGTVREDIDHGACPVIHGHKMVAIHLIRYFDNWNHYKCSTNQYE